MAISGCGNGCVVQLSTLGLNEDALRQEASERVCVGGRAAWQADVELRQALVARHQRVVVVQHPLLSTRKDMETHLFEAREHESVRGFDGHLHLLDQRCSVLYVVAHGESLSDAAKRRQLSVYVQWDVLQEDVGQRDSGVNQRSVGTGRLPSP